MFIVIAGNPFDGFRFIGPFDTWDDATESADRLVGGLVEWWAAELVSTNAN